MEAEMAQQKQKGGHKATQAAQKQQPSGKRARSREIKAQAEGASKLRAALRRRAQGNYLLTTEDHQILRGHWDLTPLKAPLAGAPFFMIYSLQLSLFVPVWISHLHLHLHRYDGLYVHGVSRPRSEEGYQL